MKVRTVLTLALVACVPLLGACGGGQEEPADTAASAAATTEAAGPAAAGSATISGSVSYQNGDPDQVISMDADPACADMHSEEVYTETMIKGEGGQLGNAFVYIKSGLTGDYSAPAEAHLLDQKGCQYSPHVSGMMVGQTLIIRNSDPTLHNVHAMPTKNAEFNQGQPFQGMELERTFDQPEVMIRFKCDVHPWMSSYMAALEHPFFAVSGEDGSYAIEAVPAGTYTVELWHEVLGTKTQEVTVAEGGAVEANFEFTAEEVAAAYTAYTASAGS